MTYFTDGGPSSAFDRNAIRDAAATVIYEEREQAEQARKAKQTH